MSEPAPPTPVQYPPARGAPPVTGAAAAPAASPLAGLVRTARPRQWVKNLLVFAAPGAAGVLTQAHVLGRASVAFGVFCLAASGTYFLNDVADRDHDRRHPTKRHRPVASGAVGRPLALGVAAALLSTALLGGGLALGPGFAGCVGAYVAVNLAYNAGLRREAVLDLAAVASGFVIRAAAGGLATGVHLSAWFLVVTSFASLFVVAGKRTGARFEVAGDAPAVEPRVRYPEPYLRFVRAVASGVAICAYCLWAFEKSAEALGGGVWFQWTIIPFVLAMLRYALLVERYEGGSPEDLLLGDRSMVGLAGVWAVLFAVAVYGA